MHPDAKQEIRETIRPPGTMKRPDSIAAWYENEAEAAVEAEWRKQALDPTYGELIAIGVADDHDREWVRCRKPGEGEAGLLIQFFGVVEAWTVADAEALLPGRSEQFPLDDHGLVGHNLPFDATFLWSRARILRVPVPAWLPPPMRQRPGERFIDTMQEWRGWGGRISLDRLCRALGIESPKSGGMDGSKVYDFWINGQADEIERYCLADVRATREVLHLLRGWRASA
jgi:hypothetical protein